MLAAALLLVAFILFALAAFGVPSGRYSLIAVGLGAWVLAEILKLGIL